MQNLLQNSMIQNRQSYFSGVPRIAQEQNALGIQRDLGLGGLNVQAYGDMNRYNLGATQMQNSFNQGNYQTQVGFESAARQADAQAQSNSFLGLGGLFKGGAGMLGRGIGSLFGPAGAAVGGAAGSSLGGFSAPTMSYGPLLSAGMFS